MVVAPLQVTKFQQYKNTNKNIFEIKFMLLLLLTLLMTLPLTSWMGRMLLLRLSPFNVFTTLNTPNWARGGQASLDMEGWFVSGLCSFIPHSSSNHSQRCWRARVVKHWYIWDISTSMLAVTLFSLNNEGLLIFSSVEIISVKFHYLFQISK